MPLKFEQNDLVDEIVEYEDMEYLLESEHEYGECNVEVGLKVDVEYLDDGNEDVEIVNSFIQKR